MPRESFSERLQRLENKLLDMGAMVDATIERGVRSLAEQDTELAQRVIAEDERVNRAQRDIEEECLVLIATQQPLAGDLRTIIAIAYIANDLERMGDHAKGNAEIALRIAHEPLLKPLIDIPRMIQIDRELLKGQLEAFINRDGATAEKLAARDDELDGLYDQIFRELLFFMITDPRNITRATYLLWVAHNLERIGDRTTNIAERTVYLVSGVVKELNPKSTAA